MSNLLAQMSTFWGNKSSWSCPDLIAQLFQSSPRLPSSLRRPLLESMRARVTLSSLQSLSDQNTKNTSKLLGWHYFIFFVNFNFILFNMREIVHIQAGQCGNQIGAKVCNFEVFPIFDLKTFGENSTKDVLEKLRCYRQSRFCSGNCCKRCERWYFWRGKWFDLQDVQNSCWHFWHFKLSSGIFVKLTSWRFSVKLVWF